MADPDVPPGRRSGGKAGSSRRSVTADKKPASAFDLWLERGLHELYDNIAQEPLPDALLNIIEQDRLKR